MDSRLVSLSHYLLSRRDAAEASPDAIDATLLPHIFVLQIEPGPRLRVRLAGTALDRAFNRPLRDSFMEDFIHGPRGGDVLRGFHDCAASREPLWMREIVQITDRVPRFVEGIAVFLGPDKIYGGLIVGDLAGEIQGPTFERRNLG